MSGRVMLEIAIAGVNGARAAHEHGADRVELNSALELGGLTPSAGLIGEVRRNCELPMMVMIRPRAGGFCYSESEVDVMRHDVDIALHEMADGIVFGILNPDGTIDTERCSWIMARIAGQAAAVFHRAFDLTPDPFAALEILISLGVERVMTSGQAASAFQGMDLIGELEHQAAGRIEILPAGGIRPDHVAELLQFTGCSQVHCGARALRRDPSGNRRPAIRFGVSDNESGCYADVDPDMIRALRAALPEVNDMP